MIVEHHLQKLFSEFDNRNVQYSILHGWDDLSRTILNDLDIVVHAHDLPELERSFFAEGTVRVIQLLQHEVSSFYFVLGWLEAGRIHNLIIDAGVDYRRDGAVFFSGEELLDARERSNGYWTLAPHVEYSYLLIKKTLKGSVPSYQRQRLVELNRSLGERAETLARHWYGDEWGHRLHGWINSGSWDAVDHKLPVLKRALQHELTRRDPLHALRYWGADVRRIWQRWWHPTGCLVAVLGPDGAGKSTLIHQMEADLLGPFRRFMTMHSFPSLFKPRASRGPVTEPHGKAPYPWWLSWLKVPYYVTKFATSYAVTIRPRLACSTLVLYDRYYDDLLADPHRYRFGGPAWLARLGRRLLPAPELTFVLDVSAETLLSRKQEISQAALTRLRRAYGNLAAQAPRGVLLDGELRPKEIALQAESIVMDYLEARYLARRSLWFPANVTGPLDWVSHVIAARPEAARFAANGRRTPPSASTTEDFGWLQRKDGRSYLVPLYNRQVAASGLDIYTPSNLRGRMWKGLTRAGLRMGLSRPLLKRVRFERQPADSPVSADAQVLLDHLRACLGNDELIYAMSLGLPGPHRKLTLQVMEPDGCTLGFAKVGWDSTTNELVQHESAILTHLANQHLPLVETPRVLYAGTWHGRTLCVQSAPAPSARPVPDGFQSDYITLTQAIGALQTHVMPLEDSPFWQELSERVACVEAPYYRHVLEQSLAYVAERLGDTPLEFRFSHGDFVAWNLRQIGQQRYFLFDWEYARTEAPPGWDLLSFFTQHLYFTGSRNPAQLSAAFRRGGEAETWIAAGLAEADRAVAFKRDWIHPIFILYVAERLALCAAIHRTHFDWLRYFAQVLSYSIRFENGAS